MSVYRDGGPQMQSCTHRRLTPTTAIICAVLCAASASIGVVVGNRAKAPTCPELNVPSCVLMVRAGKENGSVDLMKDENTAVLRGIWADGVERAAERLGCEVRP